MFSQPLLKTSRSISVLLLVIALLSSCHSSRKTTAGNTPYKPQQATTSYKVKSQESGETSPIREHKRLKRRALKRKYAAILKTTPHKIKNKRLYYFVDDWNGVKYKWGGNDQNGVDCSGFAHQLYLSVYGINIKRTVATLHTTTRNFRRQRRLREGDLIYFKESDDPTHVGVYLKNGFFVHSSKGQGVHISNLNDDYWQRTFAGGGKIKKKKA